MTVLASPPAGRAVATWPVWSTTARLVVTDPALLGIARDLVTDLLDAVDLACSRFRPDSELNLLASAAGRPVTVSPLLAELVGVALLAAERTDGDVDPTVGGALSALGYDRDLALLPTHGAGGLRVVPRPAPGWQRVGLDGHRLTVPTGVTLDLGATAKAHAADRCAARVAATLDCGVLVALGGDIATAGRAPTRGWRVLVQDLPDDPACRIRLPGGAALATSSTGRRRWRNGGHTLHHVLDPRTGRPAPTVWRSATVAADTCVEANTLTTAALVRGHAAVPWLTRLGVPARLIAASGDVVTVGDWPAGAP